MIYFSHSAPTRDIARYVMPIKIPESLPARKTLENENIFKYNKAADTVEEINS